MRKFAIGVLAGAPIGAGAAVALASGIAQRVTVTNAALRVGRPGRPAGVRLSTTLSWQGVQQSTMPSITRIDLNNPARVQEPVAGSVTRLRGNFAYHLSTTIPQNLRVVAGVPIKFVALTVTAGRGDWLALSAPPGRDQGPGYIRQWQRRVGAALRPEHVTLTLRSSFTMLPASL